MVTFDRRWHCIRHLRATPRCQALVREFREPQPQELLDELAAEERLAVRAAKASGDHFPRIEMPAVRAYGPLRRGACEAGITAFRHLNA